MYTIMTHFFRRHTLLFLIVFFTSILSACGNKGPLTVPDALYKEIMTDVSLDN